MAAGAAQLGPQLPGGGHEQRPRADRRRPPQPWSRCAGWSAAPAAPPARPGGAGRPARSWPRPRGRGADRVQRVAVGAAGTGWPLGRPTSATCSPCWGRNAARPAPKLPAPLHRPQATARKVGLGASRAAAGSRPRRQWSWSGRACRRERRSRPATRSGAGLFAFARIPAGPYAGSGSLPPPHPAAIRQLVDAVPAPAEDPGRRTARAWSRRAGRSRTRAAHCLGTAVTTIALPGDVFGLAGTEVGR
jgi:hypothetical protein